MADVGTARTTSAAANITRALGVAVAVAVAGAEIEAEGDWRAPSPP
jgi:hypothetical protein